MSEIAKASGLTREALYKALRPEAQPRFDTILISTQLPQPLMYA
jgi:probable addiction module antidote protein